MKRISIVGFGNILKGDQGIGCYLIDALCQEPLGGTIELAYVGENLHYVGAYLCDMDFAVVVGALARGGCPGKIHSWDKCTFQDNTSWLADQGHSMRLLVQTVTRMQLSRFFPVDVLFLLIEAESAEGVGMSPMMRKALRKAVYLIKQNLFRRGLLPEPVFRLSSIYQLDVLSTTL